MKSMKLKEPFVERMKELFGEDFDNYIESLEKESFKSIRANELKISPEDLKSKLEKKGWKLRQPFENYPGIIIVESRLEPGELGRTLEHLLGYYYVQEISSMLPVIVLKPKPNEFILDLAAAPGSKTTQIAAEMKNTGTLIANDLSLGRIKILSANCERCGVTNSVITRKDGVFLCRKFEEEGMKFDRILVDAPCSGEGTIRTSPKTSKMWNLRTVKALSNVQKRLLSSAIKILKVGGEIVYSTCTHSAEENEAVLDYVLKKFPNVKINKISLPKELKKRQGIMSWKDEDYLDDVKFACRIYPQDNNTEGFFISKLRKVKE